jgi:hypothetical protein
MNESKYTSEAGHWYDRDGKPAYTVIGKNGKERNTTLRDAREKDLVPSVTTILKVAAAPGLERWKQQQILLAALTLPRNEGELESDWLDRVMEDSRETGRKAADEGTAIHAAVQMDYEGFGYDEQFEKHVLGVRAAIEEKFGKRKWHCEKSFAHSEGFGGKVDMFAIDDTAGVVVDIKTKEFGPDDKVSAFDEHGMQLAAYRIGLGMLSARCANVFVSRSHPGLVRIVEWEKEDIDKNERLFGCLLQFWQLKNNHR